MPKKKPFVVAGGIVRNRDWVLERHLEAVSANQPSALYYLTGDNVDETENILASWWRDGKLDYDVLDTHYPGYERSGNPPYSSEIMAKLRNYWAQYALEKWPDATHLWVVDSDVLPARDCLSGLLFASVEWKEFHGTVPLIMGANVEFGPGRPIYMNGWDPEGGHPRRTGEEWDKLSPFEATLVGGSYLIDTKAMKKGLRWMPHKISEDGGFAICARTLGFQMIAVPDAKTTHIMERDR